MKKQNIFIDTDMGNDDIMAISYLLLKKQWNIVGISTVNGVAIKDKGISNLNAILSYIDVNIPTALGSTKALTEKKAQFPEYDTNRANNLTLLKDLSIQQSPSPKPYPSVEDFIYTQTKQETLLLCLGPLTNIAKTIQKYGKKFTSQIKGIFMMGGGLRRGNVPPYFAAEYNIYLDPEASQIVFSTNIPIAMVGIDATDNVPVTNDLTIKVKNIKPATKQGKIIKEVIVNNKGDFSSFYDPLSVFLLSNPSAIKEKIQTGITVVLSGQERGRTVQNSQIKNITVITSVNANKFYKEILEILKKN